MVKNKNAEELLEEALIPKEEQPYELPENWVWVNLESSKKEDGSFGDENGFLVKTSTQMEK
ncbi:hypothetical protein ACPOM7_04985 [Peribacillus castrilensis]|uniref:hypothetical protein n=1 Tax=Bacillaceae TaxID=186817 RepID=UPI00065FEAE5|nr:MULTISPECIES: hypothetical protein [Bacillaceae]MCP1093159.1 hypothetical protein [Bacillaceae bacterium OS4b]MBD8591667.1 hypothetical protein [Peribacillus simplex]MCF7623771.1 hypothetical protein [Peribacillus frigoritolerans]MCP1154317.1 hypothetical protein [Peribacillus frigoritolerans]MCT1390862.1 hypothetical protein [Peribacillus frigoritolerans]